MAKKKAAAKEVERKVLSNGVILVKYDDGTYAIITPISAEDAEEIFNGASEEEDDSDEDEEEEEEEDEDDDEDEDEDSDDDDDDDEEEDEDDSDDSDEDDDEEEEEEDEPITGEQLAEMDFEELENVCDDKNLETDPDEYDEKDIEKLRASVAKELGIKLPKAAKSKKETKKKKK